MAKPKTKKPTKKLFTIAIHGEGVDIDVKLDDSRANFSEALAVIADKLRDEYEDDVMFDFRKLIEKSDNGTLDATMTMINAELAKRNGTVPLPEAEADPASAS